MSHHMTTRVGARDWQGYAIVTKGYASVLHDDVRAARGMHECRKCTIARCTIERAALQLPYLCKVASTSIVSTPLRGLFTRSFASLAHSQLTGGWDPSHFQREGPGYTPVGYPKDAQPVPGERGGATGAAPTQSSGVQVVASFYHTAARRQQHDRPSDPPTH
eukprot:1195628-Prorocentrum_minimum.AAC.3